MENEILVSHQESLECQKFQPIIVPVFDGQRCTHNHDPYGEVIRYALSSILSDHMTFTTVDTPETLAQQREQFFSLLPLITMKDTQELPGNMSFFALSTYRINSFRFFYEMVSSWLYPGKRLNVSLIYAVDFRIPEFGDEIFTLCEVMLLVEDQNERQCILRDFPIIEEEIKLGICSSHYAKRILETKGLSNDAKTAVIQGDIAYLIERQPQDFDQNILAEMQHVLVTSPEEFKAIRDSRHLTRIISIHYLFRKALREFVKQSPQKRHLSLKLFRARLRINDEEKNVLAVVVGVNFFRDKEIFEKKHLLKAIQTFVPLAQAVEDSFFANRRGSEHICTLYLEIEKSNGEEFTASEIKLLRKELFSDLKDRIAHLMHPVFMPRNEEEIMRNILSLSSQIKYVRDIPQVFISFDEQSHASLFFTVILVRVWKPESLTIQQMFEKEDTFSEYIHDRCQHAGNLRRKYRKEATVFRLKLPKDHFLRSDHSIDLNKARQVVVSELSTVIGEVRDFNGGMISKQNELLSELKHMLKNGVKYRDLLLEKFFYSIAPVIMRNVIDPEALQTLFVMMLEAMEEKFVAGQHYLVKTASRSQFAFIMVKADDYSFREEIAKTLTGLHLHSSQLAQSYVPIYDVIYRGYIYRNDDLQQQQEFCQTIKDVLVDWDSKRVKSSFKKDKTHSEAQRKLKYRE